VSAFHITVLLGGVAIFLHGLQLARDGLQVLAGDRLRQIIAAVSSRKLTGVGVGALVAGILQSSTAVIIMLVGFAGSGVLSLPQSMAILLGADIGTTVTVQLISVRLTDYALIIAALGFSVRFVSRKRRVRSFGDSVLGLGLMFYGLKLLADGTTPLVNAPWFSASLQYLSANPLLCVAVAAGLTTALQGSLAMIAMLISFAHAGAISLDVAIPMVLGANIGTTVTPALSAVGQPPDAKRVAMAHICFKVAGVVLVLPLLHPFTELATRTATDIGRQIANAHTLFNVGVTLIFLPFTSLAARAIVRFYRPPETEGRFKPKYLDPRAVDTPPLAFGNATREFLRMADIVGDMLKDVIRAFETNDLDLMSEIESRDDKVDILNREIRFYLARLGQESMTTDQAERQTQLITLTSDIENIGDIVDKNLLPMARKKATGGMSFSNEGFAELKSFHAKVCENFDLALAAFSTGDEELARRTLRNYSQLQTMEASLRQTHIARLHKGLPEAVETTGIHFDMLSNLWQINTLSTRLADIVVGGVMRRGSGNGA
jgi:phosphate:Na+ symporter